MNERGFILWFTGLSGSGKSTLAREVEGALLERGLKAEVLDGDEVRANLSPDLGFSKADRDTNIRRIGYVCRLLARNGVAAIAAAISPYRAAREELRASGAPFVEVYCRCDLETLQKRDPKGLYARARAGAITAFTGLSDPYEPPLAPEVEIDTGRESVERSVSRILATLERLGLIPAGPGGSYTPEEEAEIEGRLRDLGYI